MSLSASWPRITKMPLGSAVSFRTPPAWAMASVSESRSLPNGRLLGERTWPMTATFWFSAVGTCTKSSSRNERFWVRSPSRNKANNHSRSSSPSRIRVISCQLEVGRAPPARLMASTRVIDTRVTGWVPGMATAPLMQTFWELYAAMRMSTWSRE